MNEWMSDSVLGANCDYNQHFADQWTLISLPHSTISLPHSTISSNFDVLRSMADIFTVLDKVNQPS